MNYSEFKRGREELKSIVREQLNVIINSEQNNIDEKNRLETIQDNLDDSDLKTLVMGRFSTGKSVFLNAIMGESVLPADVRPCTAVISELTYGPDWKATLYARDSQLQPKQIDISQFQEYITIQHGEGNQQSSYAKIEIEAPIAIFENGVRFVDSPGLDDPTSHDEVTSNYLPKADAIVYVMTCNQGYSKADKVMIDELRSMGYTSIIFVMTFYDQLEANDNLYGTEDAKQCKEYFLRILSPLTDLGEEGIFFVNSRGALKGKIDNNKTLLERSSFPAMEKKLEQILAAEKGRMKLNRALTEVQLVNKKNAYHITGIINLTKQNCKDLKDKINRAKESLKQANDAANQIQRRIDKSKLNLLKTIEPLGISYYDELVNKAASWTLDSKETPCDNQITLKDAKKTIAKFTQELLTDIKVRMQTDIRNWGEDVVGREITHALQMLQLEIDKDVNDCVQKIKDANISLQVDMDHIDNSSCSELGLSVLIDNDGNSSQGGGNVMEKIISNFGGQIAAGIVMVVAALFTPIGIPMLIIAAICGIPMIGDMIEPKVREKIANLLLAQLKLPEHKEKFLRQLKNKVENIFKKFSDLINQRTSEPIALAQQLVKQAEEMDANDGEKNRRMLEKLEKLDKVNKSIEDTLSEFSKTYLQKSTP